MANDRAGELLLTYPELAARLGVGPDGARTRAKRQGWPVVHGNDGRARVRVLASDLPEHPRAQPEQDRTEPELLAELRRAHAERLAELAGALERSSEEAERWRSAHGQARAEAERDRASVELLREQLTREIARGEKLAAELAESRKPALVRLLEALRRR